MFHYDRMSVTVTSDHAAITVVDFVCKIGALLALWLGVRFMSLLQFLYYSYWALQDTGNLLLQRRTRTEPTHQNELFTTSKPNSKGITVLQVGSCDTKPRNTGKGDQKLFERITWPAQIV